MPIFDPASTPEPATTAPANYRKGARVTWHQRRRHRAVLSLLNRVSGRVLDYGCGYGDLTHAIARTHQVVGCDVDPDRVSFAQQEFAAEEFVACRPDAAPFADCFFDVVVSAVVIHFVPDPRAYLDEIRRLVRPNGHLLIVCKNQSVIRNTFRRLLGKSRATSKLWVPPQTEIQSVLAERGFDLIDSTYFYDPPFEGWKNFGDWVFGLIEQLLSIMRIKGPAGYHAYLTRRIDR